MDALIDGCEPIPVGNNKFKFVFVVLTKFIVVLSCEIVNIHCP